LLELYSKFIFFKETVESDNWETDRPQKIRERIREEVIKIVKEELEFYGEQCITQLFNFNQAGIYANTMTGLFFKEKVPETGKTVMECLFTMT
jgi:hypothetical protein